MTKDQFFDLFGQIDATYILAVEDVLSGNSKDIHLPRKRIVRTLLIAAVIVSLMTITAYATGLLGIVSRIIKDPGSENQSSTLPSEAAEVLDSLNSVHHRDYISLSGVTGSPEYQAAAEWLAFKGSYADQKTAEQITEGKTYYEWRDLERSFAPDEKTKEICRLYQVWDATMWEKLQEIADNYNLSLHWERTPILGDWDQQRERGKYEDGSFTVTVAHQFGIYSLYLERAGSLPCDDMTAGSTDEYEEWEYTNAHGQSVSIAMRDVSTNVSWSQFDYLIFYSDNDATMTVKTTYGHSLNDNNSDDKAYAERLADSIDFASLSSVKLPEDALAILKGD